MNSNIIKLFTVMSIAIATALTGNAQTDNNTATDSTQTTVAAKPEAKASGKAVVSDLNAAADSAYAADNYALAEQLYLESIQKTGTSSVLFYNLGNAYYRQGFLGKAIVNYERALKLDPTNSDAKDNLAFVNTKITDKQINDQSLMDAVWNKIVCCFTANAWAWLTVILFALFLSSIAVYLFSSAVMLKKICFFGGIIVFLVCAMSTIISFSAAKRVENNSYAIILPPSSQLSTTPREARTRSEEAVLLHEGTKVEIIDSIATSADGKWYEVRVGSTERAWIKSGDVERI
jgi:tetratricopeptide (TPR) repeat protein